MRHVHCFKCGSARIDDGRSRLFTGLGVLVLVAGLVAALISIGSTIGDSAEGLVSAETTIAGFVICYGYMLVNQGQTRTERLTCRQCGTVFTPPKPRRAYTDS
jgi:hypothetical protein